MMTWMTRMSKAMRLTLRTSRTSTGPTAFLYRPGKVQGVLQVRLAAVVVRQVHAGPVVAVVAADVVPDREAEPRAAMVATLAVRRAKVMLQRRRRVMLRRGPFLLLAGCLLRISAAGQVPETSLVAPGVWFLLGDASKGYSNTAVIEMQDYLVVVDANYPGRAQELLKAIPTLSPKPVRYVFDTHAHGDHSYGNSVWTRAGATTMAFEGVAKEMDRWEPVRWKAAQGKRADVQATGEDDVQRPRRILRGDRFVLRDKTREVDFLFLGWGHTPGDGYVWLPRERILATGDGAVNGPRNKLLDAWIAHWPVVLDRALALQPAVVLPGHGPRGGQEILVGQRRFLADLYAAVEAQEQRAETASGTSVHLPDADQNWIPKDLAQDVEATYREIHERAPAGSLPHEWK